MPHAVAIVVTKVTHLLLLLVLRAWVTCAMLWRRLESLLLLLLRWRRWRRHVHLLHRLVEFAELLLHWRLLHWRLLQRVRGLAKRIKGPRGSS